MIQGRENPALSNFSLLGCLKIAGIAARAPPQGRNGFSPGEGRAAAPPYHRNNPINFNFPKKDSVLCSTLSQTVEKPLFCVKQDRGLVHIGGR